MKTSIEGLYKIGSSYYPDSRKSSVQSEYGVEIVKMNTVYFNDGIHSEVETLVRHALKHWNIDRSEGLGIEFFYFEDMTHEEVVLMWRNMCKIACVRDTEHLKKPAFNIAVSYFGSEGFSFDD